MGVSKTFSGLNQNALRYLLPRWMNAYSGVLMRLGFGAVMFWIIGLFTRKTSVKTTTRQKLVLLGIGAFFMTGYMIGLLMGLTYTTPVSSSIFLCLEPVFVFIMSMMFFHEKATGRKIIGIVMGLSGALLCICTQKQSAVASNPALGNMFCLLSTLMYSGYLIVSAKVLKGLDTVTVSKWTFTGGALTAIIPVLIVGFDAPVIREGLFSTPMLVLLFVLVFPSCLSYLLVDVGLKHLSPTTVAIYGYVILIVSTIVSYILGQDKFDWFQLAAILLIVGSVYFVELAESKSPIPAAKKE